MARLFDDAVPNYLKAGSAVLTGAPITMACWFNSDDITINQTLMCITDTDADQDFFLLYARGGVGGDPIGLLTWLGLANTSTGYSANTWHHAAAVMAAVDDRAVYLDGGSKGTDVTSDTPAGLDTTAIGAFIRTSVSSPMSGLIAEAGIWNVALSDAEVAILANGYSPLLVRPQNLVFYAPLVREIQDIVGGVSLTDSV